MAETHISHQKLPPNEEPILRDLYKYKHEFIALSKQNSSFLTLTQINEQCQSLSIIMAKLKAIRSENSFAERNKIDEVLDAIWMLLFKAWGKVAQVERNLYPVYSQLAAILRQADSLKRTGIYLNTDIEPLQERLRHLEETHISVDNKFLDPKLPVEQQVGDQIPAGQAILFSLVHKIHRLLNFLVSNSDSMSPELEAIQSELVGISRQLTDIKKRGSYNLDEIRPLQNRLDAIDQSRTSGVFSTSDSTSVGNIQPGQAQISGLLAICFDQVHDLVSAKEEVTGPLRPVYEELLSIRKELDELLQSPSRFTIDPANLSVFQEKLDNIDSTRSGGVFMVAGSNEIPQGQATLHYLLHQCYSSLFSLFSSNNDVAEPLVHIYQILTITRERLKVMKRKAMRNAIQEELQIVSDTLKAVEGTKIDGVFWGTHQLDSNAVAEMLSGLDTALHVEMDKSPPVGQATISSLLNECYVRLHELRCLAVEA